MGDDLEVADHGDAVLRTPGVVRGRVMARDVQAFTARCEPGMAHSTVVNRSWRTPPRPLPGAQVRILGHSRSAAR